MRKKLSLVILLVLTLSTSASYAEDSFWADDSSPQGQIGLVWYEDVLRSGNGVSTVTAFNDNGDQAVCETVSDEKCKSFKVKQIDLMLPVCSEDNYAYCIESISVGSDAKSQTQGKFVRNIDGTTVPADTKSNTPYGGTSGIWEVSGQQHKGGNINYSVAARFRYALVEGRLSLNSFEASIVPFREEIGSDYRFMKTRVMNTYAGQQIVHDWHVGKCIWQEQALCGVATRWAEGTVASLSLRVPNEVTGWLHGRLENPTISVKKIDSRANLITVSAQPVTVQGSAPKVNVNEISESLMKVITRGGKEPLRKDSGYVWQLEPAFHNLDWFNAWLPQTKDKADGFSDYWNFKSIAGNFTSQIEQKCLSNRDKLVGVVTTNSLWYSGNPPTFKGSELNYKVAALHFNPDGVTPFLGTYDLVLDSAAARCLYGYSSAPIQASLSILSSNGENQVATTTLTENNGWLKLSAKGFTFSDPTIKVKFTQSGSKPAAVSPVTPVAPKKSTISCKKGTTTKKISSVKPVCPAGYKKS